MLRKKVYKISKERAIELAMNHNGVSREIAEKYTNSELRELVSHLSGGAMSFKLIPEHFKTIILAWVIYGGFFIW